MKRARPSAWLLFGASLLTSCSGLGREINQALPEFLRSDPGEEEMEVFAQVRRGREWTPEEREAQRTTMDEARAAAAEGRHAEAADLLEAYLEQFPTSEYDEEARFLLAENHYRDDEYGDAFRAFQNFTTLYPVSERSRRVMDIEYRMGKEYIEGDRSVFFGLITNRSRGEEILRHLVESYPTGPRAADAQWLVARYHFEDEAWPKAEGAFKIIADSYKQSAWDPPALYYQAYCAYRLVKGSAYDPLTAGRARKGFETFLREVKDSPWLEDARAIVAQIEELQADHLLGVGEWYLDNDKPYSARFYFQSVIAKHPTTAAAAAARERLPELETFEPEAPAPGEAPAGGEPTVPGGAL